MLKLLLPSISSERPPRVFVRWPPSFGMQPTDAVVTSASSSRTSIWNVGLRATGGRMPPANRVCKTSVDLLAALDDSVHDFTEAMAQAPVEGRGALVGELARSICDLTQQLNIAIGAERRSDR